MNIRNIMDLIDCSEDYAQKVEYEMECSDFDFSEATDAEFSVAVNYAVFEMNLSQKKVSKKFTFTVYIAFGLNRIDLSKQNGDTYVDTETH